MKRIISLILCFVMILSFAACAQEQSGETQTIDENKTVEKEELKDETKETEEEKKEVVYATVNEPLTWDRINAIPVANASMSIDELRQICIDLISLQVSFTWVPEETLTYLVDRHGVNVTIEEGATVEYSLIMPGAVIKKGAHVQYAIVAENVKVSEGAVVGENPANVPNRDEWGIAVVGADVKVGKNATVKAKSMISKNVKEGETV